MSNILDNEIRLSGIIDESIVDGPGLRFVIFTQGCMKRCFMCHNQQTQPLDGGSVYKLDSIVSRWRENPLIKGITISGGEPFIQPKACLYLAQKAVEDGLDVLLYSGYYYDELCLSKNPYIKQLLSVATYLVDGPFEYKLKNLNLLFRGSSNQRVILLQETIKTNRIVLYPEGEVFI